MPDEPRRPIDPRFAPPTPFARMVYTHAASAAGDACVAASLAGSLFFASPASSSREKLLLYLLLTFLPVAVIWPVLGPVLDRTKGGRRLVIAATMFGRALLCVFMARYITKDAPEGLLIYPLAFGVLVLQKSYAVAKSSLVPNVINDEEALVRANSRLALVSGIASFAGAAPAALLQIVGLGADASLVLGALVFGTAAVLAIKIPKVQAPPRSAEEIALEDEELHQPSILLAGSAYAVVRGSVGFLFTFTAFALKDDIVAFGFAGAAAGVGFFGGNLIAPMIRQRIREESMLASAIATAAVVGFMGALAGGGFGFAIAALSIGLGAAYGRASFDALLQRDGPDALRGRAFARFELRFQALWAAGALVGLIPMGERLGLALLAAVLIFVAVSYVGALRAAGGRVYRTTIRPRVVDRAFDRAKEGIKQRRQRSRGARRRAAAKKRASRSRPAIESSEPPTSTTH